MTDTLTSTCQDSYTTAALVGALESAWTAIRIHHPEVPPVVIIVGSGSSSRKSNELKYGHYATLRWQLGNELLPEVLVSGEGLRRTPAEVLTTLLHEAVHALADRRDIQDTSRQGRWHNKRFAVLANELGLTATKDPTIGWSPCTLRPETAQRYTDALSTLATAMNAYRHPEEATERTRTNSSNGLVLECDCPRKIRVSAKVAADGPIRCRVCDNDFLNIDQRDAGLHAMTTNHHYDPTGAHHGGTPTYPYKFAPNDLATRRQLRRLGLCPGRQPIAAQILWRKGKRVAYLYRIDLARPKRAATTRQLAALELAFIARRTCSTCQEEKPYYIPRRFGECVDCALGGAR
jgi:hypothetical protein